MGSIFTPDRRVRVFVSSTLQELATERKAAQAAITALHLSPIMFELGARPHPPRDLYRAYLAQSDVFLGIYWERYGWVAPEEVVSGLEDEYLLSDGLPKLIYVKAPAAEREPRLKDLLNRVRDDDRASYKSFSTPEELAALISDDLALLLTDRFAAAAAATASAAEGAPPSITSLRAPRLPVPATRMLGREHELAELGALLRDPAARLVTVIGPGGIGKTRLALEVARRSAGISDAPAAYDGVWFVPLATVHAPEQVERTIAAAFGVKSEGSRPILESLADRLAGRRILVVLDNLEHLPAASEVVAQLLGSVEGLSVLGTSRSPLGLRGEREYAIGPLPTPPSVDLFVERAAAVRQGFVLTDENSDAIDAICRRLEGIPLAIELAAAQLRLLTPQALLTRLTSRLDLHSPLLDIPDRQRTLRATIDWSFDLLEPAERGLLLRLSVFEGGWSLDGAESVAGGDVLDELSVLVAGSLVVADETSDVEPRFRMYEVVREFAHERLHQVGMAEESERAQALYLRDLTYQAGEVVLTSGGQEWLDRLDAELTNLRAVLRRAVAADDAEMVVRVAAPIFPFWWSRSLLVEMLELAEQTAALPSAASLPDDARRLLLWTRGTLRVAIGRADESPPFFDELIASARSAGDERLLAHGMTGMAIALPYETEASQARAMVQEALDVFRRLGDQWGVAYALTPLGHMALRDGDLPTAVALHEESLANARLIDNDHLIAGALNQLGFDSVLLGDVGTARGRLDAAADLYAGLHDHEGIAACAGGYAGVALASGHADVAARLLGAAAHVRVSAGLAVWPLLAPLVDAFHAGVRAALGDSAYDAAFAEGMAVPVSDVLAYARSAVDSLGS